MTTKELLQESLRIYSEQYAKAYLLEAGFCDYEADGRNWYKLENGIIKHVHFFCLPALALHPMIAYGAHPIYLPAPVPGPLYPRVYTSMEYSEEVMRPCLERGTRVSLTLPNGIPALVPDPDHPMAGPLVGLALPTLEKVTDARSAFELHKRQIRDRILQHPGDYSLKERAGLYSEDYLLEASMLVAGQEDPLYLLRAQQLLTDAERQGAKEAELVLLQQIVFSLLDGPTEGLLAIVSKREAREKKRLLKKLPQLVNPSLC